MKRKNEVKLTANQLKQQKLKKEADSSQKIQKRKHIVLIASAVGLAVIIVALVIMIPMLLEPSFNTKNVVARMELDNGMVIDFEIYTEENPAASANFIFLVNNKFFNNTIIFDNQYGYVRFGGYEDYRQHRQHNKSYTDSIKVMMNNSALDWDTKPFTYSLRNTSTNPVSGYFNRLGYLSFLYNDTTTEFQICGDEDRGTVSRVKDPLTENTRELRATAFARAFGSKSISNIEKIAALPQKYYIPGTHHALWRSPQVSSSNTQKNIKIKSVKLYNLKGKNAKYKNYDFYENMKDSYYFPGSRGEIA